eukprot:scaffold71849_cov75-Phaeocystis_antarctica.AAC.2
MQLLLEGLLQMCILGSRGAHAGQHGANAVYRRLEACAVAGKLDGSAERGVAFLLRSSSAALTAPAITAFSRHMAKMAAS